MQLTNECIRASYSDDVVRIKRERATMKFQKNHTFYLYWIFRGMESSMFLIMRSFIAAVIRSAKVETLFLHTFIHIQLCIKALFNVDLCNFYVIQLIIEGVRETNGNEWKATNENERKRSKRRTSLGVRRAM